MKNIVALSIVCLASVPALAETCASLYVYQPYKTCATRGNGPELSKGSVKDAPAWQSTDWMGGGHNQTAECDKMRAKLDRDEADQALRGQVLSTDENSRKDMFKAEYQYKCQLQTNAYPYKTAANRACGTEDTWAAEDIGKSLAGLNGSPICLSCDEQQDLKARLECLKVTVDKVVVPKAVAIRAEQLKAVAASIEKTQAVDKVKNVLGIDETVALGELKEKVSKAAAELH